MYLGCLISIAFYFTFPDNTSVIYIQGEVIFMFLMMNLRCVVIAIKYACFDPITIKVLKMQRLKPN